MTFAFLCFNLWGWKAVYILQVRSCNLEGKKVVYYVFQKKKKLRFSSVMLYRIHYSVII